MRSERAVYVRFSVFVCSPLCLKTVEDFQVRTALIVIHSRGETSGRVTATFLSKLRACFVS